ncbi:MAG: pyruvate:ferredoxin (flavodoxin) oxidoreductase, partial [Chitinivibrionales bacterium]
MGISQNTITIDGNEAAAYGAYHLNEVIAIYPITPSSPMAELSDQWATEGKKNIWGTVPQVTEMQSEAGAAGAVHGSLQRGALTTTFTASQGLLLMIPNMYKIAGELTASVFHVAARSIATHALSIFCDHSDVMATRQTGFGLISSCSVQEAMDIGIVAQMISLESRVPFVHFLDGFRTSHELSTIEPVTVDQMKALIDDNFVRRHRARALSPDNPLIRGTAQNPDVFFQAREAANRFYIDCPAIVTSAMQRFSRVTGRTYTPLEYIGRPDAKQVMVIMGSAAETTQETVLYLADQGQSVGMIKLRLYRPFPAYGLIDALPERCENLTIMDRTKEPGAQGEPLYQDVVSAVYKAYGEGKLRKMPRLCGGRYGLSSKEFTPAMVKGIFDKMDKTTLHHGFTVGISDDKTHLSIDYPSEFSIEPTNRMRALFYGLGSDGTVSANKNSIKIIGRHTALFAQGYFVYDSRKAGSLTVSHLRFGPDVIRAPYLVNQANFVACHQFYFLDRVDVLEFAERGATFLLNSPYGPDEVWDNMPRSIQQVILDRKLKVYCIDAYSLAKDIGLGTRINTIMQTCFFALTEILPVQKASESIKDFIQKSYGKRGQSVVNMNNQAVDRALQHLHEVTIKDIVTSTFDKRAPVPQDAPPFIKEVTAAMIAGKGDLLPVSAFDPDGTFPTGTTKYEKRNIAMEIPVWDPQTCIQCGKCSMVCPHAVIRAKMFDAEVSDDAPQSFTSAPVKAGAHKSKQFTIKVSVEDCTGCQLCVEVCPAKNKKEPRLRALTMQAKEPRKEQDKQNWQYFLHLPEADRSALQVDSVRDVQFLQPLFEFNGACAGCGETQYVKLLSQLYGDRSIIANATGCSSIYGGNLPATPWTTDPQGRGPAWSNSLFEDNAEFGLGMRLALDKQIAYASELLKGLAPQLGEALTDQILTADESTEQGIAAQRQRVAALREKLQQSDDPRAGHLASVADVLVRKNVWIVGGDGWAYDIGYGGLDHILALGKDINVLVLDTEVYSNTGGQMSKASPMGAVVKFAASGKATPKKDLALMAMTYGSVYVARVAMGANDAHTLKAFLEAERYPGASIIIAYSHCIGHGY